MKIQGQARTQSEVNSPSEVGGKSVLWEQTTAHFVFPFREDEEEKFTVFPNCTRLWSQVKKSRKAQRREGK